MISWGGFKPISSAQTCGGLAGGMETVSQHHFNIQYLPCHHHAWARNQSEIGQQYGLWMPKPLMSTNCAKLICINLFLTIDGPFFCPIQRLLVPQDHRRPLHDNATFPYKPSFSCTMKDSDAGEVFIDTLLR